MSAGWMEWWKHSLHSVWHLCAKWDPSQHVYQPSWAALGSWPSFHWGAVDTHHHLHARTHIHTRRQMPPPSSQTQACTYTNCPTVIYLPMCVSHECSQHRDLLGWALEELTSFLSLWKRGSDPTLLPKLQLQRPGQDWSRNLEQSKMHYVWV